jgi:hypothetical protein
MTSLVIDSRFCGPPGSGNGGYVCGVVAACVDGPAEVTLRRPPPLGAPLAVERDSAGSVRVVHEGALVAEGTSAPAELDVGLPGAVPVPQARAAGAASWLQTDPERHPFPTCFVCGPRRPDGMRIAPGRVPGRDLSADVWCPDQDLAGPDGCVRPEFLWAALDCTGGIGAFGADPHGAPYLLGRLAVRQLGPVRAGQPHVAAGWRLASAGRKMLAGSALFTADGQPAAVGLATWIRLS